MTDIPVKISLIESLGEKFTFDPDGCWRWNASLDMHGYSRINVGGKIKGAHRVLYELLVGPIPEGLVLDHLCRVRHCVNPGHLEPVTNHENVSRGAVLKTHCKHGHEFTSENTLRSRKQRFCRACQRRRSAAYSRKGTA